MRHCVSYLVVGIELISVGSLRTEVGREAEEIVSQGGLLPDDMVLKVVTSKLDRLHNKVRQTYLVVMDPVAYPPLQHWILDGFPRTLGQGKLLDNHLKYVFVPYPLF